MSRLLSSASFMRWMWFLAISIYVIWFPRSQIQWTSQLRWWSSIHVLSYWPLLLREKTPTIASPEDPIAQLPIVDEVFHLILAFNLASCCAQYIWQYIQRQSLGCPSLIGFFSHSDAIIDKPSWTSQVWTLDCPLWTSPQAHWSIHSWIYQEKSLYGPWQ